MPAIDRLGLLHETAELTKAGVQEVSNLLDLFDAYSLESNAHVWGALSGTLSSVRKVFDSPDILEMLKNYIQPIVEDLSLIHI